MSENLNEPQSRTEEILQNALGEEYEVVPQSRVEQILDDMVDGEKTDVIPRSRVEELLLKLSESGGGGGGGGSVSVPPKEVNFYDYDGTVVNAYTASEFAALSAMPDNPSHDGLTAQGWNWSLADAKAYVAKYGRLNIGQIYVTTSGDTEIDI